MTDREIIKALERCGSLGEYHCDEKCPRLNNGIEKTSYCRRDLIISAYDLIKRQQAELDDLKRDSIPRLQDGLKRANKYGLEADKEIERQKQILNSYALQYGTVTDQSKKVKEIKSEAYKEFADLFKQEMRNCANAKFDGIKYYLIGEEFVNRRLKELAEVSNGE